MSWSALGATMTPAMHEREVQQYEYDDLGCNHSFGPGWAGSPLPLCVRGFHKDRSELVIRGRFHRPVRWAEAALHLCAVQLFQRMSRLRVPFGSEDGHHFTKHSDRTLPTRQTDDVGSQVPEARFGRPFGDHEF
jgi:hypothetical protein